MKNLINKIKESKRAKTALIATAIVAAFFGGFFAGAQNQLKKKQNSTTG